MTRNNKQIKINRNGDRTKSKAGYGWDCGAVAFSNLVEEVAKAREIKDRKIS